MPVVFGGFERVRDDSREPGGTASGFERLEHGGTNHAGEALHGIVPAPACRTCMRMPNLRIDRNSGRESRTLWPEPYRWYRY